MDITQLCRHALDIFDASTLHLPSTNGCCCSFWVQFTLIVSTLYIGDIALAVQAAELMMTRLNSETVDGANSESIASETELNVSVPKLNIDTQGAR